MSLSEVSILFGNHAGDIERARDYFKDETRRFVENVRGQIGQARSNPWQSDRVRIDLAHGVDVEGKATGYFKSQYALARNGLRFKKLTNFVEIGEIHYGFVYWEDDGAFFWQVALVPNVGNKGLDTSVFGAWPEKEVSGADCSGGAVTFMWRRLDKNLSVDSARSDVVKVLEFLLGADAALAKGCGATSSGTSVGGSMT